MTEFANFAHVSAQTPLVAAPTEEEKKMTKRTAGAAGQMKAGEPFADGENLLDLLAFDSTAAGVQVGDLLRGRLSAAETEQASHAQRADDAALAGEITQREYEAEAARLQRHVERLRLAIERADARLTEVAAAERRTVGEAARGRALRSSSKITPPGPVVWKASICRTMPPSSIYRITTRRTKSSNTSARLALTTRMVAC